jgi:transcriptional regulator with XRE-family HTH domain
VNNNITLNDFHVGEVIKEIALQKGISSKEIADAIYHDHRNADKIFRKDDMDIEDLVRISFLLEYNILDFLVKKYLPHLPYTDNFVDPASCLLKIDMRTLQVTKVPSFNNCNFLQKTHIGQFIREITKKRKLNEWELANQLQCSQGNISILYQSKSLKIKKLIQISDALQYHFIAEVYLSQMMIVSPLNILDKYLIVLNALQVRIQNPNDSTDLMTFQRNDDK